MTIEPGAELLQAGAGRGAQAEQKTCHILGQMHEGNVIVASRSEGRRRAGASPCMAPSAYACPSGAGCQPTQRAAEGLTQVCVSAAAQAAAESGQLVLLMGLQS